MFRTHWLNPLAACFLALAPAIASESGRPMGPGAPGVGGAAPSGCPVMTMKGTILGADVDKGLLQFGADGKEGVLQTDKKTAFRIPGFKRKDANLSKLEIDSEAKVTFCADDGKVLSVKVLKPTNES